MATLSSGAEVSKVFISSDPKYRVSGTYSDFTTEIAGESITCGPQCWACVSDICIPNAIYNVSSVNNTLRMRLRTSSGSPHTYEDFELTIPAGSYSASQIASQLSARCSAASTPTFAWSFSSTTSKFTCTVSNSLGVILADDQWLKENDHMGERVTNPRSISSMIVLPYPPDAAMDSYGYLTMLDGTHAKPVALIRLHSLRLNCPELAGHCLDERACRQTLKKIPLTEDFGMLVTDTAQLGEKDWFPVHGLTLNRLRWNIVDGPEQNVVELGAPISFSLCFSDAPRP